MEEKTIQTETIEATEQTNWLDEEQKHLEECRAENLSPALKLEEGKITVFEVNFDDPFEKWVDPNEGTIKKIIPVIHNGEHKVLWLNVRNPLYKQIIDAGKLGTTLFKVMRTGQQKNTRYAIVQE